MLTWQHCKHVKLCKPPHARVGSICVTHKNKVFFKKTNHYFLGVVKRTGMKWLQKDANFKLSGHIAIPANTIVSHTDCLFGVTGAGLALKNTGMSMENMYYFINCWGTESNLTSKTVFQPLSLLRKHTRRWRRHDKIYSFSPGWQTQNQKQGAHNFCGKL